MSQGWAFRGQRCLGRWDLCSLPLPLISFAPSGKEAFWGAWVSERPYGHARMHSESGRGNRLEGQLTPLFCLVLGIFLRGGWLS